MFRFLIFHLVELLVGVPRCWSRSGAYVAGRGDVGSQTTRAEIHRRNDLIRKERDSSNVQELRWDSVRGVFLTATYGTKNGWGAQT